MPERLERPASILVICPRRIGDVLLATPVVRSLKQAYPQSAIDMLVFKGTEGVLAGNRDLRAVLGIAERPGLGVHLRFVRSLWRRYDLAVSLLPGDRPTLYAWAAGRRRIGTLEDNSKSRWKRRLLNHWVAFDNLDTHTVSMNLQVLEPLDIRTEPTPVASWTTEAEQAAAAVLPMEGARRLAVLHVSPKFAYKSWSQEGWQQLAEALVARGFSVMIAGGASAAERAYVQRLLQGMPAGVIDVAGRLDLASLACLLSRAALCVGTDTAVTHLAAAVGIPTVALFGPSNPVKWGPWPKGFPSQRSPYARRGTQFCGNVALVQGEGHCVPCLLEGCARHVESESACLQMLPVARVLEAIEKVIR